MAALKKVKERTVLFYELVEKKGDEQRRLPQLAWSELLSGVSRSPVADRTVTGDATLVGSVVTFDEEDQLLLHRVKEEGEWLSVVDWQTGEVQELERQAAEGLLDTSVACFLPFGNVLGIMQGSTAAPNHSKVAAWLNGINAFTGTSLVARPLMMPSEVERLRTAKGASRVEIRIGAHKINALGDRSGRLAQILRRASQTYGDINVTMTISVPQGKTRDSDREELLNDLRDLEDVMPDAAEKARATLVYAESSGPEYRQLVQFVEHHITAKKRVRAVDDDGNAIRIMSAVDVILTAAAEHEDELRAAADVT